MLHCSNMFPPQNQTPKGFLTKLLTWVGITPTETLLLNIRISIVLLGILISVYTFITYDSVGEKYGNYEEFKSQFPH